MSVRPASSNTTSDWHTESHLRGQYIAQIALEYAAAVEIDDRGNERRSHSGKTSLHRGEDVEAARFREPGFVEAFTPAAFRAGNPGRPPSNTSPHAVQTRPARYGFSPGGSITNGLMGRMSPAVVTVGLLEIEDNRVRGNEVTACRTGKMARARHESEKRRMSST